MRRFPVGLTLFAISIMSTDLSSQVWSQSSTSQQIEQLQQQLDQLRAETGLSAADPTVTYPLPPNPALAGAPTVPPPQPNPSAGTATAIFETQEKKYPDYKITGVFQLDSARFAQSDESRQALGDIQDGTGFRRARLAASGNVSDRGSYLIEFDLAQGQARFVDVWGQIKETPLGNVRIGRFRQPFGMGEMTSVRELPMMERPTAGALAPFRQSGIMVSNTAVDQRATWAMSGFQTLSDNFGNVYGDNGGLGTAERLTFLLSDCGDSNLIHLGVGHSYINPARDQLQLASQDEVTIGQQPNLGPGSLSVFPIVFVPPFVQSGVFNVDHANLFNVEGAWSWGRTLVQAENRWSRLVLPTSEAPTVQAGYVTLRHMLTREVIPYDRSSAVFGRVKPNCPLDIAAGNWGAWEVVAQVSTINLNPLFGLPSVTGATGRLDSYTVGLNWYWWTNAKSQVEWVNGQLNQPRVGDSVSNTFAGRVQFDF